MGIHPPLARGGRVLPSGKVWRGRSCDCTCRRMDGNSWASLTPGRKHIDLFDCHLTLILRALSRLHFQIPRLNAPTSTNPLQRKHLNIFSSDDKSTCCDFFAVTLPKATGMCIGGCRLGSKSIFNSCFNQRAVSGCLFHGGSCSMLETTRQWNCRLDSFRKRLQTWERCLEEWGCCHAHSNCPTEQWAVKLMTHWHEQILFNIISKALKDALHSSNVWYRNNVSTQDQKKK